eukprot:5074257-Lingulodinium_polyedra.AAC.1
MQDARQHFEHENYHLEINRLRYKEVEEEFRRTWTQPPFQEAVQHPQPPWVATRVQGKLQQLLAGE